MLIFQRICRANKKIISIQKISESIQFECVCKHIFIIPCDIMNRYTIFLIVIWTIFVTEGNLGNNTEEAECMN
jgi:hypothetical protein